MWITELASRSCPTVYADPHPARPGVRRGGCCRCTTPPVAVYTAYPGNTRCAPMELVTTTSAWLGACLGQGRRRTVASTPATFVETVSSCPTRRCRRSRSARRASTRRWHTRSNGTPISVRACRTASMEPACRRHRRRSGWRAASARCVRSCSATSTSRSRRRSTSATRAPAPGQREGGGGADPGSGAGDERDPSGEACGGSVDVFGAVMSRIVRGVRSHEVDRGTTGSRTTCLGEMVVASPQHDRQPAR